MKYAVYDILTPTTPINVWDDITERYISAIYDTEDEANKKANSLNAYLSEIAYIVKPYEKEIKIAFSNDEVEIILNLLVAAMNHSKTPKRLHLLLELTNKFKKEAM